MFGASKSFGAPAFGQSSNSTTFGGGTGFGTPSSAFGATPSQPAPAFGGGGFGTAAPSTGFGFGTPAAAQPSTGFGSAFGQSTPAPSAGGIFGAQPAASAFGSSAPSTGFGASAPANNGMFGQSQNMFGQQPTQQPASTFGQQPAAANVFATNQAPNAFGSTFGGAAGGFGATNTATPFSASKPAFGATPFGAAQTPGAFGAATPATSGGMFGSTAAQPFGASSSSTGAFGASTSSAFGGNKFGTVGQQSTGVFGGLASASGPGSPFAKPAAATSFGSTFGATNSMGGTRTHPYKPTPIEDKNSKTNVSSTLLIQVITAMNEYKDKSLEELRWEDYAIAKGGGPTGAAPSFGAPTAMSSNSFGNGFGAAPAAAPVSSFSMATPFGSSTSAGGSAAATSGFGSTPAFGAATNTGPGFGSTTTGFGSSGFGFGSSSTAPAAAPFGSPAPAASATPGFGGATTFGTTAPAFGTTSSTFGSPAPAAFGASTSSGFGAAAPAAQTTSFGSFGGGSSSFGFGSQSAPAAAAPSFGLPSTTTPLGTTSTFGSAAGTAFGSTSAPSFGAGPGLSTFGSPKPATGLSFGTPAPAASMGGTSFGGAPATTSFGSFGSFGGSASTSFGMPQSTFGSAPAPSTGTGGPTAQPANPVPAQVATAPIVVPLTMEQKIDLLDKKRSELVGDNQLRKDSDKEDNAMSASLLFAVGVNSQSQYIRVPPPSRTKILPRGMSASRSAGSNALPTTMASLLAPTAVVPPKSSAVVTSTFGKGSVKKLVIGNFAAHSSATDLPIPPGSMSESSLPIQTPLRKSIGEATGLTPAKGGTPLAFSSLPSRHERDVSNVRDAYDGDRADSTVEDDELPTLTKAGYFCSPDISVLRRMSPKDLRRVKNFAVFRHNLGKIQWIGETDVRGLHLDDIVRIEHKEVFVYEGMEEPDEGFGLNKPARITLYDVFPKNKSSDEKLAAFELKLKAFCAQDNAEFLQYDKQSGCWEFAVKHFSRYGIHDSDDEDEPSSEKKSSVEADGAETVPIVDSRANALGASSRPLQQLKEIMKEKEKQQRESQLSAASSEWSQHDFLISTERGVLPPLYNPRDIQNPAFANQEDSWKEAVPQYRFNLPDNCPEVISLRAAKKNLGVADWSNFTRPVTDHSKSVDQRKYMSDVRLAMSRSFRVGWSADGRLAYCGQPAAHIVNEDIVDYRQLTVSQVGPVDSPVLDNEVVNSVFSALADASSISNQTLGLLDICKCTASDMQSYSAFVLLLKRLKASLNIAAFSSNSYRDILSAVSLFDATVGQEKPVLPDQENEEGDLMDFLENRSANPEHWERRRVALSNWFEDLTRCMITNASINPNNDDQFYDSIFQLISVHDINGATLALEEKGLFVLSMLLSQIGSDSSTIFLLRHQLEQWSALDALKSVPKKLLNIYCLLGGLLKLDDDEPCIIGGFGWRRALAMMYWYLGESDSPAIGYFSEVLSNFSALVAANEVEAPYVDMYNDVEDGLFSLLNVLFREDDNSSRTLSKVLQPEGFSGDRLDYFGIYVLLNILEAMGLMSVEAASSNLVRQYTITQLLSCGHCHWACFVAMQMPDSSSRELLVKHILSRFPQQLSSGEQFTLLTSTFGIPVQWIHESQAHLAGSKFDYKEQISLFQEASMFECAANVLVTKIAPSTVLAGEGDKLFALLSAFDAEVHFESRTDSPRIALCEIVLNFLTLADAMKSELDSSEISSEKAAVLRRDAETVLQSVAKFNERGCTPLDCIDEGEIASMLDSISSGVYKTLQHIDLLQFREVPAKSALFKEYVLQHARVRKDIVLESLQLCLDSALANSAKCLRR